MDTSDDRLRIGVTGGSGFIGKHVVSELERQGYAAVVLDRRGTGDELVDVRDATQVYESMSRLDGFIHLAAILGTQETVNNPRPAAETNMLGSLNVFEAAAHHGVPGVYIGVGNHWMNNPYSITKTAAERFADMYNRERGTRINVVRAMNAYGPGQAAPQPYGNARVRKIAATFICQALRGHPVEVYGDGEQVSDMVYVFDVARVLVTAFEMACDGRIVPPIEVGPAEHNTVNDVARLVIELTGNRSKIKHLPMRPGETPGARVTADLGTLPDEIDSSDFVPLYEGLENTVRYFAARM